MSRFNHPHVMGLTGVCLDAGTAPYIVMPYMANGCLLDYLRNERENLVLTESADDDKVSHLTINCWCMRILLSCVYTQ